MDYDETNMSQTDRTRRTILDAAVRALTRDSGATLSAVAAEAGV
ncbi:MAG: hypothetical protein QOG20_3151, partial [Pseudonocardiales bacterium]|nr:hypothetical protein [Pseudonocardiales bacterium]